MKTSKTSNLHENFKNLRKLQAQDLAVWAVGAESARRSHGAKIEPFQVH